VHYKIKLKNIDKSCVLINVPSSAQGFLTAEISKNFKENDLIFIAKNDAHIEEIKQQLSFFAPHLQILIFPAWDCLPFDRTSPKPLISSSRIKTLHRLLNRADNQNFLIITSVNAILQKVISPSEIASSGLFLQVGSKISIEKIAQFLNLKGYQREINANDVGQFALRGSIVDIVVQEAMEITGYRLDFFGEEIESIKVFDPLTQISAENLRQIEILPNSEVVLNEKTIENFRKNYRQNFGASLNNSFYSAISAGRAQNGMEHWLSFFYQQELESLLAYTKNAVCFFSDEIIELAKERSALIKQYYQMRLDDLDAAKKSDPENIYNPCQPNLLYFDEVELFENLEKNAVNIEFQRFDYGLPRSSGEELAMTVRVGSSSQEGGAPHSSSQEGGAPHSSSRGGGAPHSSLRGGGADEAIQLKNSHSNKRIINLDLKPIPDFALAGRANKQDPFELLQEFISGKTSSCDRVTKELKKLLIACASESFKEKINKLLFDYKINSQEISTFSEIEKIKAGKALLFKMPINFGFYSEDFFLIGQNALLGEKIIRKKNSSKFDAQRIIEEGLAINKGELVVHRDYGIAKFDSIGLIEAGGVKIDMIKLIYDGGDALFVPVDEINLISRYGAENPLVQLDKLGAGAWKNRRDKVRKKIKIAAEELIKIAAARHLKKAPIFLPDENLYNEFKNNFPYTETDDQLRAIAEIESDLASNSVMDRLVCGDVGFGKTEVAMRAAAIVAFSNSAGEKPQIAIIAPTTLLARQHYKNFSERFAPHAEIKIAQLSRLISAAKAKEVREKIENGGVQIVIGTHALLQKSIKFKNLALVIIDEEQHFGVAQKERLKELKNEVHILNLSATPIPRTLQMSLTGVKDLSLISTPPVDRIAIRNFIMPYDSVIVKEAVMREYNRGGRVFFVVPRVRDIDEMESRLKILLPEIKIAHAHGQMPPNQLDEIMNNFVDGKIDLLISTTIVESGIDIKEANLMIIYRADMFGLSQLYQLRGRVGRGKLRAYCYFMLDNRKKISDETKKKLEVMQSLDALGVGFSIASHDMDIRGSGNLLGDEQSGHIKETGVELYQQMLLEMIEKLKNNPEIKNEDLEITNYSVAIKMGISLLIPENYISDFSLRMSFYKKIANISSQSQEDDLIMQMQDRFGKVPSEVFDLIKIANMKHACLEVGISRLEATSQGILISFENESFKNPDKLLAMIFANKDKMRLSGGSKILFLEKINSKEEKFNCAFQIIKKLKELT